ncbi:uncharacterized protein LOC143018006 [Oratosquilla oratoria]|uniref:uncharacterized protein LOC143018006 n=1 Tax=Oratosquilla oratoria TaxID=337810 RepID=UPI003F774BC1
MSPIPLFYLLLVSGLVSSGPLRAEPQRSGNSDSDPGHWILPLNNPREREALLVHSPGDSSSLDTLGGSNLLPKELNIYDQQLDNLEGANLLLRSLKNPGLTKRFDAFTNGFGQQKRSFDEINRSGFGFTKRDFDEIDRNGFGFSKREFDEINRSGFGFAKRFDEIDRNRFGFTSLRGKRATAGGNKE